MTNVSAIEEEYWFVQYLTQVLGIKGESFWPPEGEWKYDTEASADAYARELLASHSGARVVHVTRRMEYGRPLTRDDGAAS